MSGEPWRAERSVDPRAAALALARHLGVDAARARPVGAGWDNAVIEVDGVYLRIAVRGAADGALRRERELLPRLVDLPLAIPGPLAGGEAEDGLPGPWMAYRPVPGEELCGELGRGRTLQAVERLARFLAALHEPGRLAAAEGVPRDPLARAEPAALAERVREWCGRAERLGLGIPRAGLERMVAATEIGAPALPPALVHGDLHMRHVMVDAAARPVGVIDWGDVCVAAPVADLAVYWYGIEPATRPAFRAAYGPIDAATLAAARRFAAFSALALMAAGRARGDDAALAGAARGLELALSDGCGMSLGTGDEGQR